MIKNINELVRSMTLEEKASLCSGRDFWNLKEIERLDIPSIMVTDGPHGLRKQSGDADHLGLNNSVKSTCFPTAPALASSWDTKLMGEIGNALAEECLQEQVAVLLGPGVNIKRSPLCGRNFEYLSEDPYLTGIMASAFVNGVQARGIGTSLKHYAVNNQEHLRMTVNAVVDERALREIYLTGYELVVKNAQPYTVMCAYNKVNGTYCCENEFLLTQILRNEWGFEGLVVSDWGAVNQRVEGLAAGMELQMPSDGGQNDAAIVRAIKNDELSDRALDTAAQRLIGLQLRTHKVLSEAQDYSYDKEAHNLLARRAVAESAVLLKNEGALPLDVSKTVAIIGAFAEHPRYQGSGSSLVNPHRLDGTLETIKERFGAESVFYAPGYDPTTETLDEELILEAIKTAKKADQVVLFAGLPEICESEGFDRTTLDMPKSHNRLIEQVASVHQNVTVVLSNGAPVSMPWFSKVNAVLESYLGGQAWGPGVADLLSGAQNPSGKLAETFPLSLDKDPAQPNFPGGTCSVAYAESIYVGYRYYDTAGVPVRFPFGYGLSYTQFKYDDLSVSPIADDYRVQIDFSITNIGDKQGKEIAQLYVARSSDSSVFRPNKELKGFTKVELQPGEKKIVNMELNRRSFAFWDTGADDWRVEKGDYRIFVGASSADIRLESDVVIANGEELSLWAKDLKETVPEYFTPDRRHFDNLTEKGAFSRLLDRPLPPADIPPGTPFHTNSTLEDIQSHWLGRLIFKKIMKSARKTVLAGSDEKTIRMMEAMFNDMPIRNMLMLSSGSISSGMLEGLVIMFNGRFFRGLRKIIREKKAAKRVSQSSTK